MNSTNIDPAPGRKFSSRLLILAMAIMLSAPPVVAGKLDETNLRVLGDAISKDQDSIASEELAHWIIQDKKDYYLIDIRSETDFAQSHIQGAVNIPVLKLFDQQQINALPEHQIIIVYSNASMRAAQASTMLRLAGLDAYTLVGGYEHWVMHTLNPEAASQQNPNLELLDDARRAEIARALKNCDMPYPCQDNSPRGYTPPLTPVEEPSAPLPASGGGVLLDEGC